MPAKGERQSAAAREIKDHAWFVCFAPSSAGQIAIAAIVEHGGHGGSAGGPIARRLLEELRSLGYFSEAVASAGAAAPPATAGEGTP
jgi:cell division protein FtsI/penicillin-binding protein 2